MKKFSNTETELKKGFLIKKACICTAMCRFPYAGNWELVKLIVGTKFRRSHICLYSQARNRQ